ncbi:MAG: hypothetical protein QM736_07885 [Vicinamibacterales bacterium]
MSDTEVETFVRSTTSCSATTVATRGLPGRVLSFSGSTRTSRGPSGFERHEEARRPVDAIARQVGHASGPRYGIAADVVERDAGDAAAFGRQHRGE